MLASTTSGSPYVLLTTDYCIGCLLAAVAARRQIGAVRCLVTHRTPRAGLQERGSGDHRRQRRRPGVARQLQEQAGPALHAAGGRGQQGLPP